MAALNLGDWLPQPVEQPGPIGSDPRRHESAVALIALSRDEPCRLHPVEQPRHVRHLGDQPVSYLMTAESSLPCSAQDPEHVVLCRGDAMRLESLTERVP